MNCCDTSIQEYLETVKKELPAFCTRREACTALGGKLSVKTLANMDSAKTGPPDRIMVGRKVMYKTETFIDWLANRISG